MLGAARRAAAAGLTQAARQQQQGPAVREGALAARLLGGAARSMSTKVKLTFMDADGDTEVVEASVGDSLLDVAHDNDIEMEGACGGEMACSTCHCILDEDTFNSLPEPEEEEEDMLDLALGLTDTSRLGCQVIVTKDMEGIVVKLPAETANMQ